mmetsp:Transcript_9693/g.18478  ORF Transcript_9693/g.18478 Transcript_9693/m.18478 type:complete len:81 (+) Transcript_9693:612-854(+)
MGLMITGSKKKKKKTFLFLAFHRASKLDQLQSKTEKSRSVTCTNSRRCRSFEPGPSLLSKITFQGRQCLSCFEIIFACDI